MNKTKSFAPITAADINTADYEALRLTNDEYLKLLSTGHPGGVSSIGQADGQVIVAGADMSNLRKAYADIDVAALLTNSNFLIIKPH